MKCVYIMLIILLISNCGCIGKLDPHKTNATIVDKEVVCYGFNNVKYVVYTTNGTFENTIDPIHYKIDIYQVQKDLEINHTYEFTLTGMYSKTLHSFPNIIRYHEIN